MVKGPFIAYVEELGDTKDPPCLDRECPTCGEPAGNWCVAWSPPMFFVCLARLEIEAERKVP